MSWLLSCDVTALLVSLQCRLLSFADPSTRAPAEVSGRPGTARPAAPAAGQVHPRYTAGRPMVQLSRRCCGFLAPLRLVTETAMITHRVLRLCRFRRHSLLAAETACLVRWPGPGVRTGYMASDVQFPGLAGDLHAVRSYSWISLPRTFRRRIRAIARSATGAETLSPWSGGCRFPAR